MSKTSGSNRRQRQQFIKARVSDAEKQQLLETAKTYGGISAMFRTVVLGARPRPNQVDQQAYAHLLGVLGQIRGDVGKIGSNLNQLAHYANLGKTQQDTIQLLLNELIPMFERDALEIRTVLMRALGFERERRK